MAEGISWAIVTPLSVEAITQVLRKIPQVHHDKKFQEFSILFKGKRKNTHNDRSLRRAKFWETRRDLHLIRYPKRQARFALPSFTSISRFQVLQLRLKMKPSGFYRPRFSFEPVI